MTIVSRENFPFLLKLDSLLRIGRCVFALLALRTTMTGTGVESRGGGAKVSSQVEWKRGAESRSYDVCPLLGIVDVIVSIR